MAANAWLFESVWSGLRDPLTDKPLTNGTVEFYEAGTSTLKTVWTDSNKTTTANNPFTLDARGSGIVFGDGMYKVVLKRSNGTTVDTINIYPIAQALSSQSVDIYVDGSRPNDNGDGFSQANAKKYFSSAMSMAVDFIFASTVTIHVEAGTYGDSSNDKNWGTLGSHPLKGDVNSRPKIQLKAENGTVVLDGQYNGSPPNAGNKKSVFEVHFSWVEFFGNWTFADNSGTNNIDGLVVSSASRVEVSGSVASTLTASSLLGTGIMVTENAKLVNLDAVTCNSNGENGIFISNNSTFSIKGALTCNSNTENGILVEQNAQLLFNKGASASALTCTGNTLSGLAIKKGAYFDLQGTGDMTLTGNTENGIFLEGNASFFVSQANGSRAVDVSGNTQNGIKVSKNSSMSDIDLITDAGTNSLNGILVEDDSSLNCPGNVNADSNTGGSGIQCQNRSEVTIVGVVSTDSNSQDGVTSKLNSNVTLSGSISADSNTKNGIRAQHNSRISVNGSTSTFSSNTESGVFSEKNSNISFSGGLYKMLTNTEYGIHANEGAVIVTDAAASLNAFQINDNTLGGIRIDNSSYGKIEGNYAGLISVPHECKSNTGYQVIIHNNSTMEILGFSDMSPDATETQDLIAVFRCSFLELYGESNANRISIASVPAGMRQLRVDNNSRVNMQYIDFEYNTPTYVITIRDCSSVGVNGACGILGVNAEAVDCQRVSALENRANLDSGGGTDLTANGGYIV